MITEQYPSKYAVLLRHIYLSYTEESGQNPVFRRLKSVLEPEASCRSDAAVMRIAAGNMLTFDSGQFRMIVSAGRKPGRRTVLKQDRKGKMHDN